jgi:hypothetical protein
MLTPNGFITKEGKNDRLVYNASFMLHTDSRPFKFYIDLADEPEIIFGGAWIRFSYNNLQPPNYVSMD